MMYFGRVSVKRRRIDGQEGIRRMKVSKRVEIDGKTKKNIGSIALARLVL